MPSRNEARMRKIESELIVGEDQQRWLEGATRSINLFRVSSRALRESLLCTMESVLNPPVNSQLPEWAEAEFNQPVSQAELDEYKRDRACRDYSPAEEDSCGLLTGVIEVANDILNPRVPGKESEEEKHNFDRWARIKTACENELKNNPMEVSIKT